MVIENLFCPRCNSNNLIKDGNYDGLQGYRCKDCKKKFSYGKYMKSNNVHVKSVKEKTIINKKHYFSSDLGVNTLPIEVDKLLKKDKILENFNILNYYNYINILSSEEMNELAKQISNFSITNLKNNLIKYLFKTNNEKFDALIIKIFIFSNKSGIEVLMEYINGIQCPKMTKYNLNVFGKYATMNISESWGIIKSYIIDKNMTQNCAYTITRYMKYLSKQAYKHLKRNIDFKEIRDLYLNYFKFINNFEYEKIDDSLYFTNSDEFYYSFTKVIDKLSKADLVNYNYLEQYNNSIFNGYNIDYELEKIKYCIDNRDNWKVLLNNPQNIILPISHGIFYTKPFLTLEEIELFGNQLLIFCNENIKMKYYVTNKEYLIWLDKFTNFIYSTIIDLQRINYNNTYLNKLLFYCKINSVETEKIALKLISNVISNPLKDITELEENILFNLIEYLNDEAIDILINIIRSNPLKLYQNFSFHFMLGLTRYFYGDFYNINDDYRNRKANEGINWENIIEYVLKEKYQQIKRHPLLDNNKIPDYVITINNKVERIIECKLVLSYREFEETIKKYHEYTNRIEFYCIENNIDEKIRNSEEYLSLISNISETFEYTIKDFNEIYEESEKYKDVLLFIYKNIGNITRKNMLKEKVILAFSKEKAQKIIYLIDKTYSASELFKSNNIISDD